ncbi:MAG: hypothetical protein ACYTHM_12375 [Planctomycetota bacterium]|jgi:hypothetical protein
MATTEDPAPRPVPVEGKAIHRRFYVTSAGRTLGFYGSVLLLCLLFPIPMILAVLLFFLFFYKKEIRATLRHPLRLRQRLPGRSAESSPYRVDLFPPGSLGLKSTPPNAP